MSKLLKLHMGFHLEGVGIYSKYVEMEIEDVRELADSAAQQACVTQASPQCPRPPILCSLCSKGLLEGDLPTINSCTHGEWYMDLEG